MRLDIFLPFLRKPKKGAAHRPDGLFTRVAKRILPAPLFADKTAARPGWLRRGWKRLGPTWLSSPVRRIAQTICFLLFLWLFFYVAWPYSAHPARTWRGLRPSTVDDRNRTRLTGDLLPLLPTGSTIHVATGLGAYLGPFEVIESDDRALVLAATANVPAERLEELRFDPDGPWTLGERPPDAWPSHYADSLAAKEFLPAESLLVIDPLVALSTALAARTWVWSLVFAGGILMSAVLIPRGFCGYICPLGTLIDLFDWVIGRRVTRWRVPDEGWWVHIKYYLLA